MRHVEFPVPWWGSPFPQFRSLQQPLPVSAVPDRSRGTRLRSPRVRHVPHGRTEHRGWARDGLRMAKRLRGMVLMVVWGTTGMCLFIEIHRVRHGSKAILRRHKETLHEKSMKKSLRIQLILVVPLSSCFLWGPTNINSTVADPLHPVMPICPSTSYESDAGAARRSQAPARTGAPAQRPDTCLPVRDRDRRLVAGTGGRGRGWKPTRNRKVKVCLPWVFRPGGEPALKLHVSCKQEGSDRRKP